MSYAYSAKPNLVVEALTYLGQRANGFDQQHLEARFSSRGCTDLESLRRHYLPIRNLKQQLDRSVSLPEEELTALFGNLPGFGDNPNGGFSLALLYFAPAACSYGEDTECFLAHIAGRTPQEIVADLKLSLEPAPASPDSPVADTTGHEEVTPLDQLMEMALTLPVPAESRLALLDAFRNYASLCARVERCLQPVIRQMEKLRPQMQHLADDFLRQLQSIGAEAFLQMTTSLPPERREKNLLCPMILSASSSLIMETPEDGYVIYCGILRFFLCSQMQTAEASLNAIYAAFHILGDRTRFDIFCFLLKNPAYGQEIANRFGLARNTVHHHMTKLYDVGLVHCVSEGNRVYYSVDKAHYRNLLAQQSRLLLDSTPEEPVQAPVSE